MAKKKLKRADFEEIASGLDAADRLALANEFEIVDAAQEKRGGFWDMMAEAQNREAAAQSPEVMAEAGRGIPKFAAGFGSTMAGAPSPATVPWAMLNGMISAMPGSPDPFSREGAAQMGVNALAGPLGKLNSMIKSPLRRAVSTGVGNSALSAGGRAAGTGELPSGNEALAIAALSGGFAPLAGAVSAAANKSTGAIRPKVVPIFEALRKKWQQAAPGALQARPQLPEAPGLPQASANVLDDALMRLRAQQPPAPAPPPEGDDLETLLRKSWEQIQARKAGQPAAAAVPQVPRPDTPLDDVAREEILQQASLAGKGLAPPKPVAVRSGPQSGGPIESVNAKIQANLKPTAPGLSGIEQEQDEAFAAFNNAIAKRKPGTDTDVEAIISRVKGTDATPGIGAQGYIDELLATPEGIAKLPDAYKRLNQAFPDGEAKDAIRTRVLQKIAEGIGTEGGFGDLSVLGRLKAFGSKDFGGQKGSAILKDLFGPDGSANLNALHDALESSMQSDSAGSAWRIIANNRGLVFGIPIAGSTAYIGAPLFSEGKEGMGEAAKRAAGVAAAGALAGLGKSAGQSGYRMLSLKWDQVADLIGSNRTKTWQVVRGMVEGAAMHEPGTVNQILGTLRRRADTDEDVLSLEEFERLARGEQ